MNVMFPTDYAKIVCICAFIVMASIIAIEWEWLAIEKADNRALQTQLEDLQIQSEAEVRRYQDAQEESDAQYEEMQKQVKTVMAMKVPKKCDEAIKWAIEEAKEFRTYQL